MNLSSSTKVKKRPNQGLLRQLLKNLKTEILGKQSILDELEDLEILGNFDKPEPKREELEKLLLQQREILRKTGHIDSDDEDEDEEDDIVMSDGDDDDDFIVDE